MKMKSWSSVQESGNGGGNKLPSGGYVMVVTNVKDVPAQEYLEITWDVADGEFKGKFAGEWGTANEWAHQFRLYYSEKCEGLFKRFLSVLEQSNESFNIVAWEQTSNENAFIGKMFGAAFGTEYYVYNNRKRDRYTFPVYYSVPQILSGDFKVPEDKVSDEYENFVEESADGADIPF